MAAKRAIRWSKCDQVVPTVKEMAPTSRPEPSPAALAALSRRGQSVLSALRARDRHKIFHDPVVGVPHYRSIVKRPMSLATAGENLAAGAYKTPNQFANAVNLIWSNCMLFNESETVFYRQAESLKEVAHRLLDEMRAALRREGYFVETGRKRRRSEGEGAKPPLMPEARRAGVEEIREEKRAETRIVFRTPTRPVAAKKEDVVKEVEIYVGPKPARNGEKFWAGVRKRPKRKNETVDERRGRLQRDFVSASAPLARRLLASLLDPLAVLRHDAEKKAISGSGSVSTATLAGMKSEEMIDDSDTHMEEREGVLSTGSVAKGSDTPKVKTEARNSDPITAPDGANEAVPEAKMTAVHLEDGIIPGKPVRPPSAEELSELQKLLTSHGVDSSFLELMSAPVAAATAEQKPLPGRASPSVSEAGCIANPSTASASQQAKRHNFLDVEALHSTLDDNHAALMEARRLRAAAETAKGPEKAALLAKEKQAAAAMRKGLAEVVSRLSPRDVVSSMDAARVGIMLAGTVLNGKKGTDELKGASSGDLRGASASAQGAGRLSVPSLLKAPAKSMGPAAFPSLLPSSVPVVSAVRAPSGVVGGVNGGPRAAPPPVSAASAAKLGQPLTAGTVASAHTTSLQCGSLSAATHALTSQSLPAGTAICPQFGVPQMSPALAAPKPVPQVPHPQSGVPAGRTGASAPTAGATSTPLILPSVGQASTSAPMLGPGSTQPVRKAVQPTLPSPHDTTNRKAPFSSASLTSTAGPVMTEMLPSSHSTVPVVPNVPLPPLPSVASAPVPSLSQANVLKSLPASSTLRPPAVALSLPCTPAPLLAASAPFSTASLLLPATSAPFSTASALLPAASVPSSTVHLPVSNMGLDIPSSIVTSTTKRAGEPISTKHGGQADLRSSSVSVPIPAPMSSLSTRVPDSSLRQSESN